MLLIVCLDALVMVLLTLSLTNVYVKTSGPELIALKVTYNSTMSFVILLKLNLYTFDFIKQKSVISIVEEMVVVKMADVYA